MSDQGTRLREMSESLLINAGHLTRDVQEFVETNEFTLPTGEQMFHRTCWTCSHIYSELLGVLNELGVSIEVLQKHYPVTRKVR